MFIQVIYKDQEQDWTQNWSLQNNESHQLVFLEADQDHPSRRASPLPTVRDCLGL